MWVAGDLKDRLGIRHRKESKNKHIVDLETSPMFREPHARSTSELTMQQGYEPTSARSPADSDVGSAKINSTDSPEHGTSQLLSVPYETGAPAVSPSPSYYSASDIPLPSPIPPSLYRYPSGEISNQEPHFTSHSLRPDLPVSVSQLDHSRSTPSPSVPTESYELQVRHPSPPSHDWTQSHSPLQNPNFLHGQETDIQEYEPDSSLPWDGPRAL